MPDDLRIRLLTHNVRGLLLADKKKELACHMRRGTIFAACLQETWSEESSTEKVAGVTFVCHKATRKASKGHASGGIAIALGREAVKAWKAANEWSSAYGDRIMAVRLVLPMADSRKPVKIFLACAYAPVSTAADKEHEAFQDSLSACVHACHKDEVLMLGGDFNALPGVRTPGQPRTGKALGPHGIPECNDAGQRLVDWLEVNSLCVLNSYFAKRSYATWFHPGTRQGKQLDLWITKSADLRLVTDTGRRPSEAVDSDHVPVRACMCWRQPVAKSQRRKQSALNRVDWRLLGDKALRTRYNECVAEHHRAHFSSSTSPSPSTYLQPPSSSLDASESPPVPPTSSPAIAQAPQGPGPGQATPAPAAQAGKATSTIMASITHAAEQVLLPASTSSRRKPSPDWFLRRESVLMPLIEDRNAKLALYMSAKTSSTHRAWRKARACLKRAVHEAKRAFIKELADALPADCRDPWLYWNTVREMKRGLDDVQPRTSMRFRKASGDGLCASSEENAEVLSKFLHRVYNRNTRVDRTVLEELAQRPELPSLATDPTEAEIAKLLRKLKKGKAPGASGIPAEAFKAMADHPQALNALRAEMLDFWHSKECAEDWLAGRLRMLPKKGDLTCPSNWRPIMLLEAVVKLAGAVVSDRLMVILEKLGLEEQCGFMKRRGTSDGGFVLKVALQKRREHGLDTWVLFVDLVKAFDSIDRHLLYDILLRFGAPRHLVDKVRMLHSNVSATFSIEDVERVVTSEVGVKQGDTLAPVLFLFVMQAAFETLLPKMKEAGINAPEFLTKMDDVTHGRRAGSGLPGVLRFALPWLLYADDSAIPFTSRADLVRGARLLNEHLSRFGLVMHRGVRADDGSVQAESKTLAMHVPTRGHDPTEDETSPFTVDDEGGIVTFTDTFRYLGCVLANDTSDDLDIRQRLRSAAAAMGQLKQTLFCSKFALKALDDRTKGKLYEALVLGILLYGCESWALTTTTRQKLNKFHNSCVRYLCGARRPSPRQLARGRPSMASLYDQLGVQNMDYYLNTRYIRWAGHVARMSPSRLPRRMLTAWVDNPRPRGKSCNGYGHWLEKELNAAGVCTETRALAMGNYPSWVLQAQDRATWRRVSTSNRVRYSSSNKVLSTSSSESGSDYAAGARPTGPTAVCTRVLRSHGRRENIT